MEKVERLAIVSLDSAWTATEFKRIIVAVSRSDSIARKNFSDQLTYRFPSPPSRRALIDFLKSTKRQVKAVRLHLLVRHQAATRFDLTTMRSSIPVAIPWKIPPIASVGELSEFLYLPSRLIDWLALHRHSHYRTKLIRKRSNGLRLLEAPKARLKAVQHRIASEILNAVPSHSAAHGFVRKRSAVSYVQPHVNQSIVLHMDLKDFFPSTSAARVFGLFRSLGYPYAVTHLLCNLCTAVTSTDALDNAAGALGAQLSPFSIQDHAARERLRSLYGRGHLPQGAPTSPALANLIAYRLDCRLTGLAASAGITYTRYADDLLFSGTRDFGHAVKSFAVQVAAIALDEGFDVNFRKSRVMRSSTRQFAAGIVLNQRTNIRRDEYDQLKATLHNCVKHGPAEQNRQSRPDYRMHLLGKINWVKQLNPARAEKLTKIFAEIDWS